MWPKTLKRSKIKVISLYLNFHFEWTIPSIRQVKLKEKPFQTVPDLQPSWEHHLSRFTFIIKCEFLLPCQTQMICLIITKHITNSYWAQEQKRCYLDSFTENSSEWSACSPLCGCGETITFGIGITYGFGRESPSSRDYSGRCSAPHIHLRLNTFADKQLVEQKQIEKQGSNQWHTLSKVWFLLYNYNCSNSC